jgi:hypothetical protein
MSKKCTVNVRFCDDCPHFDDVYFSYEERCKLLKRKIARDIGRLEHKIPKDCPLPNWDDNIKLD